MPADALTVVCLRGLSEVPVFDDQASLAPGGHIGVMGYHDNGESLGMQPVDQFKDCSGGDGVQVSCRLIAQEQ
ncbi:hypothetical protein ACRB68_25840 [Actinomadura sp. RB68]|uniref:Uncharacterized protein n=1 Tax=Actinomadura macrotermitis TaxID=2585200 RepID=A0A7K0BTN0_9ACTN|nr:hypothetical protein [Actinomadura macrotermitis]